ncbi:MAG: hypothetical protein WB297_10380 [Actinomycetota bacterium]
MIASTPLMIIAPDTSLTFKGRLPHRPPSHPGMTDRHADRSSGASPRVMSRSVTSFTLTQPIRRPVLVALCVDACRAVASSNLPVDIFDARPAVRATRAAVVERSRSMPEHPRARTHGYVFEHILVMEAFLGRHLMEDENVHH